MRILFNDLKSQWDLIKDDCTKQFEELFENSSFILGKPVQEFERAFAKYANSEYAVGVSNGTDALKLSAQSLQLSGSIGVIIPANTFVATIFGLEQSWPNAEFTLVDCNEYHQINTDELREVVAQTRDHYDHLVIVPVHLYGYTCDMDSIGSIAREYDCIVLEDASQAHGATYGGKPVGSFGKVAAFSLYPGKNLGAAGDAGVITTSDPEIYKRLLLLRNVGSVKKYHHVVKGSNHRLDTLQAIILKEKLPYLDAWNSARRNIVKSYERRI